MYKCTWDEGDSCSLEIEGRLGAHHNCTHHPVAMYDVIARDPRLKHIERDDFFRWLSKVSIEDPEYNGRSFISVGFRAFVHPFVDPQKCLVALVKRLGGSCLVCSHWVSSTPYLSRRYNHQLFALEDYLCKTSPVQKYLDRARVDLPPLCKDCGASFLKYNAGRNVRHPNRVEANFTMWLAREVKRVAKKNLDIAHAKRQRHAESIARRRDKRKSTAAFDNQPGL